MRNLTIKQTTAWVATVYRGTTRLGTLTKRYNTWEARVAGASSFHKTKADALAQFTK